MGGEWGRSRMGVLDWGGDRRGERAVLGVNFGLCVAALPKLLRAGLVRLLSVMSTDDEGLDS